MNVVCLAAHSINVLAALVQSLSSSLLSGPDCGSDTTLLAWRLLVSGHRSPSNSVAPTQFLQKSQTFHSSFGCHTEKQRIDWTGRYGQTKTKGKRAKIIKWEYGSSYASILHFGVLFPCACFNSMWWNLAHTSQMMWPASMPMASCLARGVGQWVSLVQHRWVFSSNLRERFYVQQEIFSMDLKKC